MMIFLLLYLLKARQWTGPLLSGHPIEWYIGIGIET